MSHTFYPSLLSRLNFEQSFPRHDASFCLRKLGSLDYVTRAQGFCDISQAGRVQIANLYMRIGRLLWAPNARFVVFSNHPADLKRNSAVCLNNRHARREQWSTSESEYVTAHWTHLLITFGSPSSRLSGGRNDIYQPLCKV